MCFLEKEGLAFSVKGIASILKHCILKCRHSGPLCLYIPEENPDQYSYQGVYKVALLRYLLKMERDFGMPKKAKKQVVSTQYFDPLHFFRDQHW